MIKNEPKIKNPLIVAIREQLEHRALWMYLLCDEAKKKGLDAKEYAPEAIMRCAGIEVLQKVLAVNWICLRQLQTEMTCAKFVL